MLKRESEWVVCVCTPSPPLEREATVISQAHVAEEMMWVKVVRALMAGAVPFKRHVRLARAVQRPGKETWFAMLFVCYFDGMCEGGSISAISLLIILLPVVWKDDMATTRFCVWKILLLDELVSDIDREKRERFNYRGRTEAAVLSSSEIDLVPTIVLRDSSE